VFVYVGVKIALRVAIVMLKQSSSCKQGKIDTQIGRLLVASEQNKRNPSLTACFLCELC